MVKWVLEFNKYDLYTKSSKVPDIEALKPYYQGLVDKYLPGKDSLLNLEGLLPGAYRTRLLESYVLNNLYVHMIQYSLSYS